MLKRNFLILALLVVFGSFLVAFSNAKSERNTVYEYTRIEFDGSVFVKENQQGKELQTTRIKIKQGFDLTPVFDIINKYEAEGWELYTNELFMPNNSVVPVNYFLLRRKKQ
jgi:hypothetical protein